MRGEAPDSEQETTMRVPPDVARRRRRSVRRRRAGRGLLSAVALAAVGGAAVFTTQATFTDSVTMAQVTVQGGTLDLKANSGDGPNQSWSVSMNVTGMAPGQEQSGTVTIANSGTLPFTATVSTTGTDASGCFSYFFRETSAPTGATKASSFPVLLTGMGTAAGADGTTAAIATSITNRTLADNGADVIWETDDSKVYTLTARMKTSCTTNGASGTFNVTFNATQ